MTPDLVYGAMFALLLIFALAWDNRNHPGAWYDHKEDRHFRSGRRHGR